MIQFMGGIMVGLCSVAALIFLKFWRRTRDRLFLLFSIAFWIFVIERTILASVPRMQSPTTEADWLVFVVRLIGFLVLLAAIIDKNRRTPDASSSDEPTPPS